MVRICSQDLIESAHGAVYFSEDALESGLGGHDVEDEGLGLSSAVAEDDAVFVGGQCFFEVMSLKLFCSLSRVDVTLSSFCLSTLMFKFYF